MVKKNVFGDYEYCLENFFIPHRKGGTGKYAILKREPWCVTDPVLMPFWDKPPLFDSYIHAVVWLKENVDNLI